MGKTQSNEITCRICKKNFTKLTNSHLKTHGITAQDYSILFGENDTSYISCSYPVDSPEPKKCTLIAHPDNQFCILHDDNKDKDQESFNNTFQALYRFFKKSDSNFHYKGIVFPSDINFFDFDFDKKTNFFDCKFYGSVSFMNEFYENVHFNNSIFYEDANFSGSKFYKETSFNQCIFLKDAIFLWTVFNDYANFWDAKFNGLTIFRYTKFYDRVEFGDNIFPQHPYFIRFIATKFKKGNEALFSGVDFSTTVFRFTNLSEIYFENVRWPVTSMFRGSRRYLIDELFPTTLIKYEKEDIKYSKKDYYVFAQQLYRQLKWNYEEKKNYTEAGDFYYGEMECFRKSNPFRRYLPSLLNLYRISSGYGQKYIRAFIVLILMLFTFATAHIFMGLEPNGHNKYYSNIKYTFNSMVSNIDTFSSDLLLSTVYCVEVLTREDEPDRLFRPMRLGGEILNSTFSLLVYIQVLFFILALRRHFKR